MRTSATHFAVMDEGIQIGGILKKHVQRVVRKHSIEKSHLSIFYFFFVKSLRSLSAIRVLLNNGYYQDAVVLTRTIFEACVQFLYIRIDPIRLSQRYLAHEVVARRDLSDGVIRSSKRPKSDGARKRWVGWAAEFGRESKRVPYSFEDAQGWSGKSMRELTRFLDKRCTAKDKSGFWADYELFYSLSSAIAHSSPISMQEYMASPLLSSYRQISIQRAYFRHLPLAATSWCLLMGWLCAADHNVFARDFDLARVTIDAQNFLLVLKSTLE